MPSHRLVPTSFFFLATLGLALSAFALFSNLCCPSWRHRFIFELGMFLLCLLAKIVAIYPLHSDVQLLLRALDMTVMYGSAQ